MQRLQTASIVQYDLLCASHLPLGFDWLQLLFGVFHFLLPVHEFLLAEFGLLGGFFGGFLHVAFAFGGEVLPDDPEDLVGVVGGDGGTYLLALEHDFDELLLVLAVVVEGEPVVEVLAAGAPAVRDALGADHGDPFDLREHDGAGSGQGEVVLVDDDQVPVEGDLLVEVENFCHLNYQNLELGFHGARLKRPSKRFNMWQQLQDCQWDAGGQS